MKGMPKKFCLHGSDLHNAGLNIRKCLASIDLFVENIRSVKQRFQFIIHDVTHVIDSFNFYRTGISIKGMGIFNTSHDKQWQRSAILLMNVLAGTKLPKRLHFFSIALGEGKVSILFNDTANLKRLYCVILIVQN